MCVIGVSLLCEDQHVRALLVLQGLYNLCGSSGWTWTEHHDDFYIQTGMTEHDKSTTKSQDLLFCYGFFVEGKASRTAVHHVKARFRRMHQFLEATEDFQLGPALFAISATIEQDTFIENLKSHNTRQWYRSCKLICLSRQQFFRNWSSV